jgi:asparagine N-glycosylation enzyme membrane subunit Stt3
MADSEVLFDPLENETKPNPVVVPAKKEKKQYTFNLNEHTATEFLFLCLALVFFLLCVWGASNNNLAAVPFGILSLYAHNTAMGKRLSR